MPRHTPPNPTLGDTPSYVVEWVPLASLHPHPRNYNAHPEAQLAHLAQSIAEHGFYRNIVVARDNTILAGHGVVEAAQAQGYTQVPVMRMALDADDPQALKILVGDNESPRLAAKDEARLAELLEELRAEDPAGLLGTGFDEAMLTALGEQSGVIPPDFQPVGVDEQGRLDQKAPITCPHCGEEFVP